MAASLKQRLRQDKLIKVFCLGQLFQPKLVELLAGHGGFEGVWFDQEHAGLTQPQIEEGARAARAAGIDCFIRLTATDYATVMRSLEAGAGGIMAAQVKSAAEVEEIVRWAKFHPRGIRGVNTLGVDGRFGAWPMTDYFRRANESSFVAIQIERADALEEVEKIAAVPDVDLIFVGPADLSQSMGIPGEWDHPRHWQALERVARACRDARVPWGILPANPGYAERCRELGCRLFSIGIDVWAFQKGLAAFQREYVGLFSA